MMLKDSTVLQQEPVKMRWIGYKSDGNTVCHHYGMAYPYKEFWLIEHVDEYNQRNFQFSLPVGKNLVPVAWESQYNDVARLEALAEQFGGMTEWGYLNYLDKIIAEDRWMKNSEIQALREFVGKLAGWVLADEYQEYHDRKEKERRERDRQRHEEYERKRREDEERRKAEAETAYAEFIRKLKDAIENGGTVENTQSAWFVEACDRYEVEIPLRTRGWMMNNLVLVGFTKGGGITYRYMRRSKNSKGSQKVWDILRELKDAIIKEE